MRASGQKTAEELFQRHLVKSQAALRASTMPQPPFQGALTELFVTRLMGWKCVSGPEVDKYDALCGELKIEIKSSMNGRKPSPRGKDFHEFCWLKLELRAEEIWAKELTCAPKHQPHVHDLLGGSRSIFHADPESSVNYWIADLLSREAKSST